MSPSFCSVLFVLRLTVHGGMPCDCHVSDSARVGLEELHEEVVVALAAQVALDRDRDRSRRLAGRDGERRERYRCARARLICRYPRSGCARPVRRSKAPVAIKIPEAPTTATNAPATMSLVRCERDEETVRPPCSSRCHSPAVGLRCRTGRGYSPLDGWPLSKERQFVRHSADTAARMSGRRLRSCRLDGGHVRQRDRHLVVPRKPPRRNQGERERND